MAFWTHFGHFEHLVCHSNFVIFQPPFKSMSITFSGTSWIYLWLSTWMTFLYSQFPWNYITAIWSRFSTDWSKSRLHVKAEKCEFEHQTSQFLGLVILTRGMGMDSQKVSTLLAWLTPIDKKGYNNVSVLKIFPGNSLKLSLASIKLITQLTKRQRCFQ